MLTHAGVFSVDFSRIDTGKTVCFLVSGGLYAAGFYIPQPREMRGKMTDAPFAPYCKMPRGLL